MSTRSRARKHPPSSGVSAGRRSNTWGEAVGSVPTATLPLASTVETRPTSKRSPDERPDGGSGVRVVRQRAKRRAS